MLAASRTPIIVVGHRNPDNDSICSAVAYAYLKNELAKREGREDEVEYIPARLGPLPPESEWVLESNGLPLPMVVGHVHTRVADVMTPDPITISQDALLLDAGRVLRKHNVRSLVVAKEDGSFRGLIGTRAIANRYTSACDLLGVDGASTMAVAASLIESLEQKVSDLVEEDVLTLDKEALFKDAVEDLMASTLREGVVVDDDGVCIGILTRSDVATRPKRKVILVDHNETRQAAIGIEDADVVEIVDHHRIADVSTANPIQFLNYPVGSTATIITREFRNNKVKIPKAIAAVLLSAIMTDTVILKSPTSTEVDEEQVEYLASILKVDPIEFGLQVFQAKTGKGDDSAEDIVGRDAKEFQIGDYTVLIAQHETVDLKRVMSHEEEIREVMRERLKANGYEFVMLLVTDILAEGSQFMVEGNRRIVNRVFNIECTGVGGTWMPGILSRKKQVAPRIIGN